MFLIFGIPSTVKVHAKNQMNEFGYVSSSMNNFEWFQDNVVYEPQFAHRIVLAAASPYFNAMFTNDLVEARRPQIYLQNINGRTLKSLLHFVYFGEICLNQVIF